ncbi:hypothetical protein ACIBSW_38735 [Actinoplanes sp. NPDC049668]|uniref:hypothetical protein n=1 Tax=unclassified Actinoplanes TaxID=2626549 RepID=UPI0033B6F121
MPEMRDLIDSVASDLADVRWPPAEELRRRARRRRQRTIAAAVALVTAVTAGAASLARPDREPPPRPATSPTVGAPPVRIPPSVLLRPEDVGAGPDSEVYPADAFQPIQFEVMLDSCFRERAPGLLALRPRYSQGQTLMLGTEAHRPARAGLLNQTVYRLSAPEAAVFVRDLRVAVEACADYFQTGEIEPPGGRVKVRSQNSWSILASGFAGDESILVRGVAVVRDAETGEVIGESSRPSAFLRVGDLVTVLVPRIGTSADDLRRFAATAAQRLCATADPPC